MQRWSTYELIFFDCDSTISTIEGIDELARMKGKELRVGLLTQKAMDGELDLEVVYGKRLQAINPTRSQMEAIKEMYAQTLVPDAAEVIQALQYLKKHVYIISGGLLDAVQGFGERLGIPKENIRAVELEYNTLSGEWWRYYDQQAQRQQKFMDYEKSPLTVSSGKPKIVRELAGETWGRRMMVGDGASDLATRNNGIDLFVGFGGVVKREKVEQEADVFLYANTLAPILPMASGAYGLEVLRNTPHEKVFKKGLDIAFTANQIRFREEELKAAFLGEFENRDL